MFLSLLQTFCASVSLFPSFPLSFQPSSYSTFPVPLFLHSSTFLRLYISTAASLVYSCPSPSQPLPCYSCIPPSRGPVPSFLHFLLLSLRCYSASSAGVLPSGLMFYGKGFRNSKNGMLFCILMLCLLVFRFLSLSLSHSLPRQMFVRLIQDGFHSPPILFFLSSCLSLFFFFAPSSLLLLCPPTRYVTLPSAFIHGFYSLLLVNVLFSFLLFSLRCECQISAAFQRER